MVLPSCEMPIGFCVVAYSQSLQILPDVTDEGETSAPELLIEVSQKEAHRRYSAEYSAIQDTVRTNSDTVIVRIILRTETFDLEESI